MIRIDSAQQQLVRNECRPASANRYARGGRSAGAADAEDGGDRPAHRRHRPRFQQYAGRRHQRHEPDPAPAGARRDGLRPSSSMPRMDAPARRQSDASACSPSRASSRWRRRSSTPTGWSPACRTCCGARSASPSLSRPCSAAACGRPMSTRTSSRTPSSISRQRARRHARRRPADHRDRQLPSRRRLRRPHADVPAGQYVLIAVTDTGTGMAPEVAASLRSVLHHQAGRQGHGPWPFQVFGFVKQSGGHVKIYSEPGRARPSRSICRAISARRRRRRAPTAVREGRRRRNDPGGGG